MKNRKPREFLKDTAGALRVTAISLIFLGGIYTAFLAGFGAIAAPFSSRGSLIRNAEGAAVGSVLIAQKFTQPFYFWPRPSAVDYDASAAGGSNLPPSSPELERQVKERIAALAGTAENPVPVDLLAASGSGLDPHLTLAAAVFQTNRVAAARGLDPGLLREWIGNRVRRKDNRRGDPLVNVLQLNIALDERFGLPPAAEKTGRKEETG